MNRLIAYFLLFIIIFCGCTSDLNKQIDRANKRIDSLELAHFPADINPENKTSKYSWFNLGEQSFQIVSREFYVGSITTSFMNNGFQVSGIIGNVSSMAINGAMIECAIKDSTKKEMVVYGYTPVQTLVSGDKETFSVFIPTIKQNVSQIGILVRDYKMYSLINNP